MKLRSLLEVFLNTLKQDSDQAKKKTTKTSTPWCGPDSGAGSNSSIPNNGLNRDKFTGFKKEDQKSKKHNRIKPIPKQPLSKNSKDSVLEDDLTQTSTGRITLLDSSKSVSSTNNRVFPLEKILASSSDNGISVISKVRRNTKLSDQSPNVERDNTGRLIIAGDDASDEQRSLTILEKVSAPLTRKELEGVRSDQEVFDTNSSPINNRIDSKEPYGNIRTSSPEARRRSKMRSITKTRTTTFPSKASDFPVLQLQGWNNEQVDGASSHKEVFETNPSPTNNRGVFKAPYEDIRTSSTTKAKGSEARRRGEMRSSTKTRTIAFPSKASDFPVLQLQGWNNEQVDSASSHKEVFETNPQPNQQ